MADLPVPTADRILQPALEKMYTLRPASFKFLNLRNGVYWHPFLAYRAQTAHMLRDLGLRVAKSRLKTATGKDLREYIASEYDALPDEDQTYAVGELTLRRLVGTTAGDIPRGTRFLRRADLLTQIPLPAAYYETELDVHFDVGQLTAGPVPLKAVTAGTPANHPLRTDTTTVNVVPSGAPLFDSKIFVDSFNAAGGVDLQEDDYARKYARAQARGQYGPTESASRLGALSVPGVRNILVYDLPGTGTEKILVADKSWGSSARFARFAEQAIYDADLVGNGCKVEVDVVWNIVVSIEAVVVLRDVNFSRETTEIDIAIRAAVKSYLDDRQDWNVWKTDALRAAISRAHPKIYYCSAVLMRDTEGAVVSEITVPDYSLPQYHYALSNNAVKTTYTNPT